jgi:hypothetical protein
MDNNLAGLIKLLNIKKNEEKEIKKIKGSKYNKFRKTTEEVVVQSKTKKPSKYNKFRKNKEILVQNEPKKVVLQNKLVNKKEPEKVVLKNKLVNKKEPEKVVLQNKKESEKVVLKNKPTNKKESEKVVVNKKEPKNINNNLNGWTKYNVNGDGSCAFHSIMLYYEKTNQKNVLDKKYGNSGHSLRNEITKNVEQHINVYNHLNNNSNNRKYLNGIYKHPLVNSNKSTIIKHMTESLEILKKHETYTTNDELQIISAILCKKIFVWNETEKKWYNISISDKCNFEIKDSIFLYFNINHYQLLLPDKNYIFKSSYNNLPKEIMFNYNFLEKIVLK